MQLHVRFEWDPDKADSNALDLGVTFEEASAVLKDPMGDRFQKDEYQFVNGEDRWLTFASHPEDRDVVLAIVWTERIRQGLEFTRIISARFAEPWEQRDYEKKIYNR